MWTGLIRSDLLVLAALLAVTAPAAVALPGPVPAPATSSAAQACPSLAGAEGFGLGNQAAWDVAVQGRYAYTGDRHGMTAYDLSDPAHPVQAAQILLPRGGYGIAVSRSMVYLGGNDARLYMIDVSDPGAPEILGSVEIPGYASVIDVDASTGLLAVTLNWSAEWYGEKVVLIDASDPSRPILLRQVGSPGGSYPCTAGMLVTSDVLYATCSNRGELTIFDVSDPAEPVNVGSTGMKLRSALTLGEVLYARGGGGLAVVDVSDPLAPRLVHQLESAAIYDVAASNGTLLTVTNDNVQLFDLADPQLPVLRTALSFTRGRSMAAAGSLAAIVDDDQGLSVVDVSLPAPAVASRLKLDGDALGVAAAGDMLYVANDSSVELVDVSDPERPVRKGSLPTRGGVDALTVAGDALYYLSADGGLAVVDVSDATAPRLVGEYDLENIPLDISICGDLAYVAEVLDVGIFDVSDAFHPLPLATLGRYGETVSCQGSTLYVTWGLYFHESGTHLDVYDVSDAEKPVRKASRYRDYEYFSDVAPWNRYLLVRSASSLQVLDAGLARIGRVSFPFNLRSLEVMGGIAVAGSYYGQFVSFVDVSDPVHLGVVETVDVGTGVIDTTIVASSSTVWTASGAIVEGVRADCVGCAGMRVSASDRLVEAGGETTTVTVQVVDLSGKPAPGQEVVGTATAGTVGDFVDWGDGSYTAEYTSGPGPAIAEVAVSVNGEACPRAAEIVVRQLPHRRGDNVSEEIGGWERSGP